MSQDKSIRFDRRIDLEWLDAIAANVALGDDEPTVRAKMFSLLDGVVSGGLRRGSASYKTLSVLSGVWVRVSPDCVDMRNRAAGLLGSISPRDRVALHWAMMLAAYPFFGDVAENTGRLLSLQGNLALSQLTRRMRETWGDRSTLDRATQRVVRSMVQWGVLVDTEDRGVFSNAPKPIRVHGELAQLILEGLLIDQGGNTLPHDRALRASALFPFDVSLPVHGIRDSERFEVFRQGLDVDVVGLRNERRKRS